MAQPLQSINLVAPAFKGVNTEDSPIAQDPSFADVADNAVIDKRGRIASRKGLELKTTNASALGTDYIHVLHHFFDDAGNEEVFSTGNQKILSGTTVLNDITPSGYVIIDNDWKIVNFNDAAYFFNENQEPLIYTNAGGLQTFGQYNGASTPVSYWCNEVLPAFGRLWIANNGADSQTIYWSDLLIGTDFTGGSSGSIDVSQAWPDGSDEIVALAAHNNLLIIFGRHSILVYQNANSPANMALADTIAGVGCADKNSVQYTGTDVLFLAPEGLRSFGRVIQEKSLPLSDLSINIKTDLIRTLNQKTLPVSSVYSPENTFYLLSFLNNNFTYCFDMKGALENGSYRVTRWVSSDIKSFERKRDGTLLVGTSDGICEYSGYSDMGNSYRFSYFSPGLTFGDPSKLKILKKIRPVVVGANSSVLSLKWSYDLDSNFRSAAYQLGNQISAEFNLDEFAVGEFTGGELLSRRVTNATGDGSIITIGLEADINGFALSLQEINVLALIGKTL